jgi:hypothetical protein
LIVVDKFIRKSSGRGVYVKFCTAASSFVRSFTFASYFNAHVADINQSIIIINLLLSSSSSFHLSPPPPPIPIHFLTTPSYFSKYRQ